MNQTFVKKIKIFLLANFLFGMLVLPFMARASEEVATPENQRCDFLQSLLNIKYDNSALEEAEKEAGNLAEGLPRFCTLSELLLALIDNILKGAAIFAVIIIMWGGYSYLFSAGDEEQAEKGKKTLMYAIMGLVIIIMAFTIVRILASTLTSPPGGPSASQEAGGGGSGGTQNPGSVSPQGIVLAPIPSSVSSQGPFSIIATVRADKAERLALLCGGSTDSCLITVSVDGQQRAQSSFSKNITQFVANASVPGPFNPGSSLDVVVKINGVEVSSGAVQVSGGGNSYSSYTACLNETGDVNGCCDLFPQERVCAIGND